MPITLNFCVMDFLTAAELLSSVTVSAQGTKAQQQCVLQSRKQGRDASPPWSLVLYPFVHCNNTYFELSSEACDLSLCCGIVIRSQIRVDCQLAKLYGVASPNVFMPHAGVTEFLHEMLQLSGKAIFHCLCQEPAILYSDVYSDLLPMHEYFDTLHWAPADYKHIIVRSDCPSYINPNIQL